MKMDLMEKMHNYKSEINKRKHGCSSHCGPPSKGMRLTNSIMERCSPAEFPFNAPILGWFLFPDHLLTNPPLGLMFSWIGSSS